GGTMALTPVPSLPMYFPPDSTGFDLSAAQTCATLVEMAYQQFNIWVSLGTPNETDFSSNTTWQQNGPSGLSYSTPIWSNFPALYIKCSEPFGFVAWDDSGNVYVVFRGTMTTADDLKDAEIAQCAYTPSSDFGQVHEGFFGVYQGLQQAMLTAVNACTSATTVYLTGHSMGSALSSLAAPD